MNYSIKEFAEKAGVSQSAIYQQLDGRLKPYVITIKGKKRLDAAALREFYEESPQEGENFKEFEANSSENSSFSSRSEADQNENEKKIQANYPFQVTAMRQESMRSVSRCPIRAARPATPVLTVSSPSALVRVQVFSTVEMVLRAISGRQSRSQGHINGGRRHTGATTSQGTVSTASRSRRRCGSAGRPSRISNRTISRQRSSNQTREPSGTRSNTDRARSSSRSKPVRRVVIRLT